MTLRLEAGPLDQFYAAATAMSGRDRSLRLAEIRLGPQALDDCVDVALAESRSRVVLVQDETPVHRSGHLVKPLIRARFSRSGADIAQVVLTGPGEVHTTTEQITTVQRQLRSGDVVVALGSGTIADITKHAVHAFETAHPGVQLRLVVIQTANSVCAYTSGLAVVTTDGVKRTLPSRLPDVLVLDTQLLAEAPEVYTLGGIGDASVAAGSFADYRLVHLLGLGPWEPLSWELMQPSRTRLLGQHPVLADRGDAGTGTLGIDLAACGLAMTWAGDSAPLSGLEHVTSHMLDMAAPADRRPVGNHGSQCALATILTLIAYRKLLDQDRLVLESGPVDDLAERERVYRTFARIDDTGKAARECWADYRLKLTAWQQHQSEVQAFADAWSDHRAELSAYVADPAQFVAGLAAAGHPLRFDAIPTGLDEDMVRWAFGGARLMRKRTNVADLLSSAGLWTEDFLDDVFADYRSLLHPYFSPDPANQPAKELL
ncbi:MAG: iron-containing alcohol dehydrogenase [Propioniciclava sp.]